MSRGLGKVQRACLRIVEECERVDDWWPTTYDIAAMVYDVPAGEDGISVVEPAQHAAVRRALLGLQRQGRLIGFRTHRQRDPGRDGRLELSHHWMTEARLVEWLASEKRKIREWPRLAPTVGPIIERIERKATAIGMLKQPAQKGPATPAAKPLESPPIRPRPPPGPG